MEPVHTQVLESARRLAADPEWTFRIADLIRHVPHLNAATVRTHVASRCCVNAPANHQSRHPYFRALGGGTYRIEPPFRRGAPARRHTAWQDRIIAALDSGIDETLLTASLTMTPTERLDTMRHAAISLDAMRKR